MTNTERQWEAGKYIIMLARQRKPPDGVEEQLLFVVSVMSQQRWTEVLRFYIILAISPSRSILTLGQLLLL